MVSRFLVGVQNDPGDFSCVGSAACPVGLKAFRSPEGAEEYIYSPDSEIARGVLTSYTGL